MWKHPRHAVLSWLAAGFVFAPSASGAQLVSDVQPGSPEYQAITDAIRLLQAAGGDPAKPPSPAWLAQNIQTFLNQGKIKNRRGRTDFGSNTVEGGDVYIHFDRFESAYGAGWDPNTEVGLRKLIYLARTLAHEKFHSENHGIWDRLPPRTWAESQAYHHEYAFLDELGLAEGGRCASIPRDEPARKLACYRRLRIIYEMKQAALNEYSGSDYSTFPGKPMDPELVELVDDIVELLNDVIPRWEELAEEAEEADDDEVGQILDDFDEEHGTAIAGFHEHLESGEREALAALAGELLAMAAERAETEIEAERVLGRIAATASGDLSADTFGVLAIIDMGPSLLTEERPYSALLTYDASADRPVHATGLAVELRYVLETSDAVLSDLLSAEDVDARASELLSEGAISVTRFEPDGGVDWRSRAIAILAIATVVLLALLARSRGRPSADPDGA